MKKKINYLGIIPARKGSKGIPSKNIVDLGGLPLIEWTFKEVEKVDLLDFILLSTDDNRIIELAKSYNKIRAPFVRPQALSQDNSTTIDVIKHAIHFLENKNFIIENIVLLQPTSPFRTNKDIETAIIKFDSSQSQTLFSVCEPSQHPEEFVYYNEKNELKRVSLNNKKKVGRQNYKKVMFIDGAIYISSVKNIKKTGTFIQKNSSIFEIDKTRALDIDTPFDLTMARALINYLK